MTGLLVVPGLAVYAAVVARAPWIATPLLLMTLPFYLRPLSLSGIELSLTELAILGAVLALSVRWALTWWRRESSDLAFRGGGVDWIAAALLASGLVSLLVTEYPRQSLRELRWLILEPIIVFYLVRATIRTSPQVLFTLGSLAASGALASMIALMDLMLQGTLLQRTTRAITPYLSANHLALFLERSAAASLALALFGPRSRSALGAGTALIAAGLARTISVGAWLSFGGAALILISLRSRRWAIASALALALAISGAFVVLPPERALDRLNPATGTGEFRLQIWASSLHMLADHPILGVGMDNFLYLYRSQYMLPEAWEEPNISHPHNWVLQFWLQLGLPGLLTALAMATWVARAAHRRFYHPDAPSDRPLAATALGGLVAFLAHGAIDNSYFLVDLAIVWWVIMGLLAVPVRSPGVSGGEAP